MGSIRWKYDLLNLSSRLDWQLRAKCKDADPSKWYVENLNPLDRAAEAEALCRGCPVMSECYYDASNVETCSVFAGYLDEWDSELETVGVVRAGVVW